MDNDVHVLSEIIIKFLHYSLQHFFISIQKRIFLITQITSFDSISKRQVIKRSSFMQAVSFYLMGIIQIPLVPRSFYNNKNKLVIPELKYRTFK